MAVSSLSLSPFQRSILSLFEKLGFCFRCQLRFTGVTSKTVYVSSELQRELLCNGDNNSEDRTIAVDHGEQCLCPACMGLLQKRYTHLSIDLKSKIQKQGYRGLTTFSPSTKVPHSLFLRQTASVLFLKENIKLEYSHTILEVKDVLKMLLQEDLSFQADPPNETETDIENMNYESGSPFLVEMGVRLDESYQDADEFLFLNKIPKANFRVKTSRKRNGKSVFQGLSIETATKACQTLELKDFIDAGKWPLKAHELTWDLEIVGLVHSSLFVGGRYRKLQRHISHSPWVINKERLTQDSVEELIIGQVHKLFKTTDHKFASSGREDADVLMLGDGRPFYFELKNPKIVNPTKEELEHIQKRINLESSGKIEISDLSVVSRAQIKELKDSVQTKAKSYRCYVRVYAELTDEQLAILNAIQNLDIIQGNPTRVPRRADLERNKTILTLDCRKANERDKKMFFGYGLPKPAVSPEFKEEGSEIKSTNVDTSIFTDIVVEMKTSAGTYVKEFVHSDVQKTTPSLISLLEVKRADVLALDVIQVHLDWPVHESIVRDN